MVRPGGCFRFYAAVVVCYSMSLRVTGLVGIVCLMVVGCATKPTVGEAQWRTQLERQQQGVREAGRIGYIGYEGQAPEGGSGH